MYFFLRDRTLPNEFYSLTEIKKDFFYYIFFFVLFSDDLIFRGTPSQVIRYVIGSLFRHITIRFQDFYYQLTALVCTKSNLKQLYNNGI